MAFVGMTRVSAPGKTTTPESAAVRRAPDPLRGVYRAMGNRALGAMLRRCPGGCPDGGCAPADEPDVAPPIVDSVLRSAGQPLDDQSRTHLESRFGHDLSSVRLHTDATAARSAEAVGASGYTVGNHVVLGTGYASGTASGQRLLAHELTHVIQQDGAPPRLAGSIPVGQANDPQEHEAHATAERVVAGATVDVRRGSGPAVRRQPAPQPAIRRSGPVDWKRGMRATLLADVATGFESRKVVKAGTLVEVVANPGFGIIQVQPVDAKARAKEALQVNDLKLDPVDSATQVVVPVPIEYELLDVESGTNWGAAGGRSVAIGGARGLGYLVSPPVRSAADPLLPLASRLRAGAEPLGVAGDVATLERYLTSPVKELTPRFASEASELLLQEYVGQSWWQNNFALTQRQLSELPGLVARASQNGLASLAPAEQQLVQTFLQAHAQSVASAGQKIASPALSTTAREGLSAVGEAAPFFRRAPYVVRIRVPADAVLDVNAAMGARRMPSLVYEAEMLVFTDARGSITSVRPNPVGALGRATPVLRWAGRGLLVIGAAISIGRIATATPKELPRVIGEEGGGWLGAAGGSALGAGACIAFGIVTEGIGLVICGLAGGIGGGLGGSYLGGELGEAVGNRLNESAGTFSEVVNPIIERSIWGDKAIPPIGYTPRSR